MSCMCHTSISISFLLAHSLVPSIVPLIFFPDHCFIQDHSRDQTIGMGRRQGNLYLMELRNFCSHLPVVKVVCNSVNLSRIEIWHYRLKHPSYVKLQVLSKDLHISGDLTTSHHCSIFHLAKQCHLSFVSHNSFSDSVFQLIQCDLYGAFYVATNERYCYFFFYHYWGLHAYYLGLSLTVQI